MFIESRIAAYLSGDKVVYDRAYHDEKCVLYALCKPLFVAIFRKYISVMPDLFGMNPK